MTAASLYTLTNEGIIRAGTPGSEFLTPGPILHGAPIPKSSTREQSGSPPADTQEAPRRTIRDLLRPSQEPHRLPGIFTRGPAESPGRSQ
eukprot:7565111-Karenia_brevis.AAC.1